MNEPIKPVPVQDSDKKIAGVVPDIVGVAPNLTRISVPEELAKVGIGQGLDQIALPKAAVEAGVQASLGSLNSLEGSVSLPIPLQEAEAIAESGKVSEGRTDFAILELRQYKREGEIAEAEEKAELKKAA